MSDLREFATPAPEETGNRSKIVGAAIIAVAIAAIGVYGYESGMWNPPLTQMASNNVSAPIPTTPPPTTEPIPPPVLAPEMAPAPTAPQAASSPPARTARVTHVKPARSENVPDQITAPPVDVAPATPAPDITAPTISPEPTSPTTTEPEQSPPAQPPQ